ncbi:MAG: helix-turn-helix transcriptional regulator [Flavobacteriales bacterium]|nr:helix-turn-helix transcriptional regulator [Flavobacteriales bacterium]
MKSPKDKNHIQLYIGKRIKRIREEKGVPQQVLAAQCNMEKSNLSRLESGRSNPTYYTLYKISFYLNIPLSNLTELKENR